MLPIYYFFQCVKISACKTNSVESFYPSCARNVFIYRTLHTSFTKLFRKSRRFFHPFDVNKINYVYFPKYLNLVVNKKKFGLLKVVLSQPLTMLTFCIKLFAFSCLAEGNEATFIFRTFTLFHFLYCHEFYKLLNRLIVGMASLELN